MELMTALAIIGILATLAIPNYSRMIDRTHQSSCIANQRAVCRAASMYANEIGMINGSFNVGMLQLGGHMNEEASQCPSNTDGSVDDCFNTITAGQVSSIVCDVLPAEHDWSCPI